MWESAKLDYIGVPPPCKFSAYDLNRPDIWQRACGAPPDLFDKLQFWYSFVILLNQFSGSVNYNKAWVGGWDVGWGILDQLGWIGEI